MVIVMDLLLQAGGSGGRGLHDEGEIILLLDGMLGCLWSVGIDECNLRHKI